MDEDRWDNRIITITIIDDDWKMLTEKDQERLFEKITDLTHDFLAAKLNTPNHGHDKPAGCYGCNVCVSSHIEHVEWGSAAFDLP